MDDLLVRVLVRLLRIHDELGERAYRDAGNRALLAIARAAHAEAEGRAPCAPISPDPIVRFPLDRACRPNDTEEV